MEQQALISEIYNCCWLVRYYRRNQLEHAQAVMRLGVTCRRAFEASNDYEAILLAIVDGLAPASPKRL